MDEATEPGTVSWLEIHRQSNWCFAFLMLFVGAFFLSPWGVAWLNIFCWNTFFSETGDQDLGLDLFDMLFF